MFIKKSFFLIIISIINQFCVAQNPVSWSTSFEKVNQNEYIITYKASIEENWHLYGLNIPPEGPLPTLFNYNIIEDQITLKNDMIQGFTKIEFDSVFNMNLSFFEKEAIFKQSVIINNPSISSLTGEIEYQACDDKVCIFRNESFVFNFSSKPFKESLIELSSKDRTLTDKLYIDLKNKNYLIESPQENESLNFYWNLFFLGFLGGLIALLTPCVFPMIPLTVSFFLKSGATNSKGIINSFVYGFFIISIYFILSLPFHFIDSISPEILNNISTNVVLNLLFFIVFVLFAFSFFGYFNLSLPNSWSNKSESASSKSNFIGIFFMALTLAIVSFSCTGPILGSLLASSLTSDGGAFQLTIGMTGFGAALAFPFALLALFPNILKKLPKSGVWMKNFKVILGFFELALALKFLSNADLVSHWGILPREIFLGIWIFLSLILSLYLFGLFKFPHEPKTTPNFSQKILGLSFLIFSFWLSIGVVSNTNKFKLFSGFVPPEFYSIKPRISDCPLGLECYKDFDIGFAVAKEKNKPILLDFTGWACVNCRKIEENVWSKPRIFEILSNEIVLISLYVDDREKLSKENQFNFQFEDGRVKKIKTIGDKWATFQSLNFSSASQPFYVLMSSDGKILNSPIQYTNEESYFNWLKNGLNL